MYCSFLKKERETCGWSEQRHAAKVKHSILRTKEEKEKNVKYFTDHFCIDHILKGSYFGYVGLKYDNLTCSIVLFLMWLLKS